MIVSYSESILFGKEVVQFFGKTISHVLPQRRKSLNKTQGNIF